MKVQIEIPQRIEEIPLKRWQEYASLEDVDKENPVQAIAILSGISEKMVNKIPIRDLDRAAAAIIDALGDTERELAKLYTMDGLKYGFEPELDKMSIGMLADVTRAFDDPSTWNKALAILYRPVVRETKHLGGLYAVENYDADVPGFQERQEMFQDSPASLFAGVQAFFLRGISTFANYIQVSTILAGKK